MSRDLRRYANQTTSRLVAGVIAIVFIVGGGLIYLIYGREAALLGVLCLITGLSPLVLIALIFRWMDWIVKRERNDK